jgi:hypothetical protein
MDYRLLVIASGMVILLAIAIAATGVLLNMAYATSYEKSQTITQTNECGNYWFPINIICSNLGTQTQGDENSFTASAAEDDQVKENIDESSQSFTPFP